MSPIHPTAIIDPLAEIHETVTIGPHTIIEGPVRIGPDTRIAANCYIYGDTHLGAANELNHGVVIGTAPQHLGYKGAPSSVRIGDNNVFREYSSVHRAYHEGKATRIGSRCYFMVNTHVAHDCIVGDDVIMANGTLLGGHVTLGDRAVLSGNVGIHQFVRVGELTMIGGLSKIVKDIPPYMMANGQSEVHGVNTVGLRRAGFSPEVRTAIKRAYELLYRSDLNVPNAVTAIEQEIGDIAEIRKLVDFIRSSSRGISRHGSSSVAE